MGGVVVQPGSARFPPQEALRYNVVSYDDALGGAVYPFLERPAGLALLTRRRRRNAYHVRIPWAGTALPCAG